MKLKITLMKSTIGRHENQIRTVKALGLKKIRSTVVQPDNPANPRHDFHGETSGFSVEEIAD